MPDWQTLLKFIGQNIFSYIYILVWFGCMYGSYFASSLPPSPPPSHAHFHPPMPLFPNLPSMTSSVFSKKRPCSHYQKSHISLSPFLLTSKQPPWEEGGEGRSMVKGGLASQRLYPYTAPSLPPPSPFLLQERIHLCEWQSIGSERSNTNIHPENYSHSFYEKTSVCVYVCVYCVCVKIHKR